MTQNLTKPLMDFISTEIENLIADLTTRKGDDQTKNEKFELCIDELKKLGESILSHDYAADSVADDVAKADSHPDADYKQTESESESSYEIEVIRNLFSYIKPTHETKFTPDLDIAIIPDDDPMLLLSELDLESISESIKTIDLATCWHQSAMFKFCKLAKSWLRMREHDDLDQEKDATISHLNLLKTRLGDITKQLYLKEMFFENQLEVNQDKDIEEQVSKFYKEQEHSKFIESLMKTSLELYTFPTPKGNSYEESKSDDDIWSDDSSDEEQNESKSDVKQSSILEKNKEEPLDRKRLRDPFEEQQEKSFFVPKSSKSEHDGDDARAKGEDAMMVEG